jgi:O-antigen/teichoic acid export membrane protein
MTETTRSIASTPAPPTANGSARVGASSPKRSFSRALRDVLWLSSSSFLSRILNLGRGVVLARLLTPFDFGVYGLATSIVGVKERIADIGAGNFLVYRPEEIEQHVETTFWVNLVLSSALLGLLAAVAPILARIYRQPLLTLVLVLLGLGVWARVNASIHMSLLRTHSRFRALAIIDNCSSAAWLAVAVGLAWKGFGVWALVVSALAANLILAALLIATQGWMPRWRLSESSLRLLGGFSFWYLGQGITWYLAANVDRLLIGRYLGMALLGIYTLAYTYASLAVSLVGNAMSNVAFAELPKSYGQDEEFWSRYCDFSRASAIAASLVAFAGAVAAPDLIPMIFGAKWSAAIVPFQILSVSAALRCIWLDPFLALGNFRLSCLSGLIGAPATALAVYAGLRFGLAGVCLAVATVQGAYEVGALLVMTRSWSKLIEVSRLTIPYLAGSALAALAALGVRHFVRPGVPGGAVTLAMLTLAVFTGVFFLMFRRTMKGLLRIVFTHHAPGNCE